MHKGRTFIDAIKNLILWLFATQLAKLLPPGGITYRTNDMGLIPEAPRYTVPVEQSAATLETHREGHGVVTHSAAFGAMVFEWTFPSSQ